MTRLRYAVTPRLEKRRVGGIQHVDMADVASGGIGTWVAGEAADRQGEAFIANPGDVVIGKLRPYLRKGFSPDETVTCSTEFLVLTPKPGWDTRFLMYFLLAPGFTAFADATVEGAKMPRTSWDSVRDFALPRFSLERQRAVARLLDRECARLQDLDAHLEALGERLLIAHHEEAAGYLLDGDPAIRLKYLTGAPVTGDWGADPGESEIDVPCVRVTDFDRASLGLRSLGVARSYPRWKAEQLALKEGDLILEKSGGGEKSPVGFVVRCDESARGLVCSNFVARIRPASDVDSLWLVHVLGAMYHRRVTARYVRQVTGIQNLDIRGFLNVRVPDIDSSRQCELAYRADEGLKAALDAAAHAADLRVKLAEYRDALITQAVAGHLDVAASDARMDENLAAVREGEPLEVLA